MRPTSRTCPVCRASDNVGLAPFAAQHLVKCRQCGLVYASLKPGKKELAEYYASYPYVDAVSPITLLRYDELLQRFAAFRRLGRILDVGCGGGHFLDRAMRAG
ncbi:MAG: hypothetical protein KBF80_07630 [Flavobacteriales bacterium]|nr:hypothetical protein [Flavobacteriales bacterium]